MCRLNLGIRNSKLKVAGLSLCVFLVFVSITGMSGSNIPFWPFKPEIKLVTYYPKPTNDIIVNPYMGIAPEADDLDITEPHSLVYAGVSWKELEPEKGQFDFESFERRINYSYWKDHGVRVILRIYLDYPRGESHTDIPDWLYYETKKGGTWYKGSYGYGFSPNYSNLKIIYYHEKLINAVSNRYKNDNSIAFIELGSIGHWGEWHTQVNAKYKVPFPTEKTYNQYVQHYLKYFPSKFLLVRRPLKIAKTYNMGLYNDSFGNDLQTEDCFIQWFTNGYMDEFTHSKQPAMPDFWKTTPSGGEFSTQPGEKCLDNANIERTIAQLKASHTSWLGPSCPVQEFSDPNRQNNWNKLAKKMGYRYVIKSATFKSKVQPGETVSVNCIVENAGIAPFYFKWPMEIALANADQEIVARYKTSDDIRKWLPGTNKTCNSIKIPADLPNGSYSLCLAIIDPANDQPGINLAITERRSDGRYTIGQLSVIKS